MKTNKTDKKTKQQEDSSQIAYQGIRHMLYTKELVPGQKIAYRDLAEKLQLSPTPIIQALKWLELQGFVTHEANRGYYMAPFSLEEIEELYDAAAEDDFRSWKDGAKQFDKLLATLPERIWIEQEEI